MRFYLNLNLKYIKTKGFFCDDSIQILPTWL